MSRYENMFQRLDEEKRIAFIPFTLIGDPDLDTSMRIVDTLVEAGADALELGIPFSDPVADGPTIQTAGVRALKEGITPTQCLDFLKTLRIKHHDIPIGLLLYVNLVFKPGIDPFFAALKECEVDSVLIADVPLQEATPYLEAAEKNGLQQVFIAPPNADDAKLKAIAAHSKGYTYVVTRTGVTGADEEMSDANQTLIEKLKQFNAPRPILGFGISNPTHVAQSKKMGASGAISGSAIVRIIESHLDDVEKMLDELTAFVRKMKKAT